MYKSINKGRYSIALNKFPRTAKNVSSVYLTGFHKWKADDCTNYSVVLGVFRIIFYINKVECGEKHLLG